MTERTGSRPGAIDPREREMTIATEGLDVVATRTFAAPRVRVFRAFTDCRDLVHWWGPAGWSLPVCEMDFQVGGSWFYCMRGPNGEDSCGRATYHEIAEPERIVYTDAFTDRDGAPMAGMPEMRIMVEFRDAAGGTEVVSRARFGSAEDLQTVLATGMETGLRETWDRLADHLTRA